jgi:hypothetical protein
LDQGNPSELFETVAVVLFELNIRWLEGWHAEKFTAASELLRTMAVAEEAVVADAMKARGQDMQQEAADELIRRDGHGLLPIVVPIVLPAEADRAICDVEQSIVGDGNAVRIASDVLHDLLRSGERRLGIDHPLGLPHRSQVAQERTTFPEWRQGREELQFSGVEGGLQMPEKQATEETR